MVLARALRAKHQIDTYFIVCDPRWVASEVLNEFSYSKVLELNADSLVRLIDAVEKPILAMVLQYSGYGFSKRGAPLWLLPVFEKLRKHYPEVPLVTMFHELYADGPITSSAFWIKPLQKWVLRGISRASDGVRTNRHAYAQWLAQARRCDPSEITTFPIFSNFGEIPEFVSFAHRHHRIALFQPPSLSNPDGRDYWACWRRLRQQWPHLKTIAVGRCGELPDDDTIERAGYVSAAEASKIMQESTLGIINYYDGYLAKSSIFAAYAAHGIGCILPQANRSEADGIIPGKHYLTSSGASDFPDMSVLEQMALRLHAWYAPHCANATAASYAGQIERAIEIRA